MCDEFKDVEANHGIDGEGANGMDPWEGDALNGMENEGSKTNENDRKLERDEGMAMEG